MRNGAIFLTRRDVVMEQHSIWGTRIKPYIMPEERSVDIDSEFDCRLAELILSSRTEI
jgi:CMP-N-acetylneuraminic acid synthetase